jgi:glycosyltransferase involved in cell wall biosynthesis
MVLFGNGLCLNGLQVLRLKRQTLIGFSRTESREMRIVIATSQVPFVRGGAELHAEGLLLALQACGHEAEIVSIPFKWYPPERILEHMLACRFLDLTGSSGVPIDLMIGLKFPAYLIPHPNKVLWILHQFRSAYDLWDNSLCDLKLHPNGAQVRDAIHRADLSLIPEARKVFTNSANVSFRLKNYCGIESIPLYHPPPNADRFHCEPASDYIFFPSRIGPMKRQALILDALSRTTHAVKVHFAGTPEYPPYMDVLMKLAQDLGVNNRVKWLGHVTEQSLHSLYAKALGIVFVPLDEDYGYVTLEAMLSSKPLITCTDSGGPLEFVIHNETGLVVEPSPEALAAAMDQFWENRERARIWGMAARDHYESLNISWVNVTQTLLS